MKVLLVDISLNQMKSITGVIGELIKGVEIIGMASDVQSACQALLEHHPDIILISKELKSTDGFTVASEIRKLDNEAGIIVYGEDESVTNLKRAIEVRAHAYLVKPINKEKLRQAIERICETCERRRHQLVAEREILAAQAMELIEFSFVYSVLYNEDFQWEWKSYQHMLNLSGNGYVIYVTLEKGNYKERISYERFSKLIKKNVTPGYRCIVGREMSRSIVIFVMEKYGQESNSSKVEQIRYGEYIRKVFRDMFQIEAKVGIGGLKPIDKIVISYEEALRSLRYDRMGSISHVQDVTEERKEKKQFYTEMEEKFLLNIRDGNKEALNNLVTLLDLLSDFNILDKKNKLLELIVMASNKARRDGGSESEYTNYMELLRELDSLAEGEINAWAFRSVNYVLKSVRDNQNENSFAAIRKVLRYVDTHYDEDITLEEVAGILNISPQYFSRIFKEKMGVTYVDYLTNIRIKKAQEWLIYSDKNIQEICYMVGYKDPNYFSRVFKKTVGVTPKQFVENKGKR